MTKVNHLHPMITEPLGSFRRCDVSVIRSQIGSLMEQFPQTKNIVEQDEDGAYHAVGLWLNATTIGGERYAIRVLYTFWDLYEVQMVSWSEFEYKVTTLLDMVDAFALPEVVKECLRLTRDW